MPTWPLWLAVAGMLAWFGVKAWREPDRGRRSGGGSLRRHERREHNKASVDALAKRLDVALAVTAPTPSCSSAPPARAAPAVAPAVLE